MDAQQEPPPLVFISYEFAEGREYADRTKVAFEAKDLNTWVWHHDRKHVGYLLDDIMDAIDACDFFVYICTEGSDVSRGQKFERDYAWEAGKDPPVLLSFHKNYVSRMHKRVIYYNEVSNENYSEVCETVAAELLHLPRPPRTVGLLEEEQAVES